MSGRSQALRLPARFRFQCKDVQIEAMGRGLWVEPCDGASQAMGSWLEAFYADHPLLPEDFLAERGDTPPEQRDWS